MKKTQMWLLVRSNPAKKDSIHYTFAEAQALQNHLSKGWTGRNTRPAEKTEIHEITVDRELCDVALVRSSFSTQMRPENA